MKEILDCVSYIILDIGMCAGIILIITLIWAAIRSSLNDETRSNRQEERDNHYKELQEKREQEYHERRMKELTQHGDKY